MKEETKQCEMCGEWFLEKDGVICPIDDKFLCYNCCDCDCSICYISLED